MLISSSYIEKEFDYILLSKEDTDYHDDFVTLEYEAIDDLRKEYIKKFAKAKEKIAEHKKSLDDLSYEKYTRFDITVLGKYLEKFINCYESGSDFKFVVSSDAALIVNESIASFLPQNFLEPKYCYTIGKKVNNDNNVIQYIRKYKNNEKGSYVPCINDQTFGYVDDFINYIIRYAMEARKQLTEDDLEFITNKYINELRASQKVKTDTI